MPRLQGFCGFICIAVNIYFYSKLDKYFLIRIYISLQIKQLWSFLEIKTTAKGLCKLPSAAANGSASSSALGHADPRTA